MNRSDAEHPELGNLSSQETEDTTIVDGGEDKLAPFDDSHADVSSNVLVEHESEPITSSPDTSPEFVEGEAGEHQYAAISGGDVPESLPHEPDGVEAIAKEQETLKLPQQVNGWQRLQRFFMGGSADDMARLNNLTQAIEDAPESPVNYVLRAELYMKMREYALAQADFQRAYELAETQFELADWGLLDQVMRDRALAGLEKVQRRL